MTPLMTIARRFERVSDQAKNICEEVLYMCTGEYSKHTGAEVLRILFVDEHNSCRSQMAEAVAQRIAGPGGEVVHHEQGVLEHERATLKGVGRGTP